MMEIKFMEMDAQIIVLQKQDGDVIPSQDQEKINAFNAYINVLVVQIKQYKDAFHAIMDLYKIKYHNNANLVAQLLTFKMRVSAEFVVQDVLSVQVH